MGTRGTPAQPELRRQAGGGRGPRKPQPFLLPSVSSQTCLHPSLPPPAPRPCPRPHGARKACALHHDHPRVHSVDSWLFSLVPCTSLHHEHTGGKSSPHLKGLLGWPRLSAQQTACEEGSGRGSLRLSLGHCACRTGGGDTSPSIWEEHNGRAWPRGNGTGRSGVRPALGGGGSREEGESPSTPIH